MKPAPLLARFSSNSNFKHFAPFLEARLLAPHDLEFAATLAALAPTPPEVLLGAACVSAALARGNICLDLRDAALLLAPVDEDALLLEAPLPFPEPSAWRVALETSPLVSDGQRPTPLVLEGPRLYLHRYFDYQRRLAKALASRRDLAFPVDAPALSASLDRLFASVRPDPSQRRAAETALRRGLTVISGGPGTGKTSTVVRILGALLERHPDLRATLVAPTGKAAARLSAAIREQKDRLDLAAPLKLRLPEEARTIHAALGFSPRHPSRFTHGPELPLPADVVIVDEASMVDLALMTKLVEAVPPEARLILLGDRDQLASVEAGHVLGDIADAAAPLAEGSAPLAGTFVALEHGHRFEAASGIGQLADAIRRGDEARTLALLDGSQSDLVRIDPDRPALERLALAHWSELALADTPEPESMAALGRFQVLCAHRRGPFGAGPLSEALDLALRRARGVSTEWYPGRAVMVLQNDASQDLWNGDSGLTLGTGSTLRVHFPPSVMMKRLSSLAPSQLPPHAPLFATTIHKAQGSGFDHVLVVLPPRPSPLVTRELLYTAVTRARRRVTVMGSTEVLAHALRTQVKRASGLTEALAKAARSGR